jgi:uncharacterized protein (DUF58 family)
VTPSSDASSTTSPFPEVATLRARALFTRPRRAAARSASHARVTLTRRSIYIVPTRAGLALGATLALMLAGSINYNLGLGYVLTFLLAGLGVVGMLHTWRNLAGLEITPGRASPAFAGGRITWRIRIANASALSRGSVGLWMEGATPLHLDVPARDEVVATLDVPADRRGRVRAGRVRIATIYPLGLFRAWSYAALDMGTVVYPKPEDSAPPLPASPGRPGNGGRTRIGEDEFSGVRDYRPGDAPARIAWKAMARADTVLTKQFAGGEGGATVHLDLASVPHELGLERALSRLAAWVTIAEDARIRYALVLPGRNLHADNGPAHRSRCLEALALHGER